MLLYFSDSRRKKVNFIKSFSYLNANSYNHQIVQLNPLAMKSHSLFLKQPHTLYHCNNHVLLMFTEFIYNTRYKITGIRMKRGETKDNKVQKM